MKKYLKVDTSVGYPANHRVFIECGICGISISTLPSDNVSCDCKNIRVDVDMARISIKNDSKVRYFEVADGAIGDKMS